MSRNDDDDYTIITLYNVLLCGYVRDYIIYAALNVWLQPIECIMSKQNITSGKTNGNYI